ncbi:MAG: hypothetical protein M3394_06355 [Actinomycetota bacterium]|nr:hypothetical protein [Actinomycetota bacterium]
MKRRSWLTRMVVGTLAAGALLATEMPVSKAECVWGTVFVTRKNADPIPVWGPGCIVPDDGTWGRVTRETDSLTHAGVPDGTPNGYFYDVIVTSP